MDYGIRPVKPYSPRRLSGYFDAFAQNPHAMQDPSAWMTTLACLRTQKEYLDDLLSKTAITLNALRDKQSRNNRVLSTNPGPRSKKKKVLQNRWRTDKTIKTCENEEKVILDCLQVCESNMHTLESIINLMYTYSSTTGAECDSSNSKYSSYTDSATTDFDWNNGWVDEGPTSPFQRERKQALVLDEIPPEVPLHGTGTELDNPVTTTAPASKHAPPLPPRIRSPPPFIPPPPAPPNTAHPHFNHSVLSPQAASFEPSVTHYAPVEERPEKLDKLSISGLLASKRMSLIQAIQGCRFSDAAIGHIFRRLSKCERPALNVREHKSWGPDAEQYDANAPRNTCAESKARSF